MKFRKKSFFIVILLFFTVSSAKSQNCFFEESKLYLNDFFINDSIKKSYSITNNLNEFYSDIVQTEENYFSMTRYDNGFSVTHHFMVDGRPKGTNRYYHFSCDEVEAFGVNYLVLKINDEVRFYEVLNAEKSGDSFLYILVER